MTTPDIEPIREAVLVHSDLAHTFHVFVRDIGRWWPTGTHSIGGDKVVRVVLEERTGGRLHEAWADGTEHTWARVLAWDPPAGFTLSWDLQPETEVELRFRAAGPGLTRVELEHRGWERLRRRDDGTLVRSYRAGWPAVLSCLVARFPAGAGRAR